MAAGEPRSLFASGRVAHLATADVTGTPHLVPICFALDGDAVEFAVDQKPKRTTSLKRLANIRSNPFVSLLVDHYDDRDWSALWWARADGTARIIEPGEEGHLEALARLAERYEQYRRDTPGGPAVRVAVERWSAWRAA